MTEPGWAFGPDPSFLPAPPATEETAVLTLTPDMIVAADAGHLLTESARQVEAAAAATLAMLAGTQAAASAVPAQLIRDMKRPAAPRATAPKLRPARGLVLAGILHGAVLAMILVRFHHMDRNKPQDEQVVSLMMVPAATPAPATPSPPKPVTPTPPAPPLPVPPTPAALPLPVAAKPAELPPAAAAPRPPPATKRAAPATLAPATAAPAPAAQAAQNEATAIPAHPDAQSANEPPAYPERSRQLGEEGEVFLDIFILADGLPARVTIIRSCGYPALDQAARAAILRWRFTPATQNGMPVASTLTYHILFQLQ